MSESIVHGLGSADLVIIIRIEASCLWAYGVNKYSLEICD